MNKLISLLVLLAVSTSGNVRYDKWNIDQWNYEGDCVEGQYHTDTAHYNKYMGTLPKTKTIKAIAEEAKKDKLEAEYNDMYVWLVD